MMICYVFHGIALFAILRQKYLLGNVRKDVISQLPDDILVSIISHTSTKESIRTSVLSKRWRDLYKSVPNVNLCCYDLHNSGDDDHSRNYYIVINRLRNYLLLRSGSKIRSLSFRSCWVPPVHLFELCIARFELEELDLQFLTNPIGDLYFSFSCHLLYEMQSLKYFHLKSCNLKPNLKSQKYCNSLQTLRLTSVKLYNGALDCIFSNCLSLHSLKIEECKLIHFNKLCICGPNLRLKSLQVKTCEGLTDVELYAPNLVRLELTNSEPAQFIFNHVPQLQTVFLYLYPYDISYIRGTLAKDLPHLNSLSFITGGDFYQESINDMDIYKFSNLRRLDFSLDEKTRIDLLSLIPFLQSCPILQEFHLDASSLVYSGRQVRKNQVIVPHEELQRVEITGFCGTENEMDFASYIVKSAVVLEKICIFSCGKKYTGFDTWHYSDPEVPWTENVCRTIHRQLKEEIISKKAQIIVQSALLRES